MAPKSNAQRQQAYRAARATAGVDGNGERKLSMYVTTESSLALKRLAIHYGVTKRQMVEKLLIAEDQRQLDQLKDDEAAFDKYLTVTA